MCGPGRLTTGKHEYAVCENSFIRPVAELRKVWRSLLTSAIPRNSVTMLFVKLDFARAKYNWIILSLYSTDQFPCLFPHLRSAIKLVR